MYGESSCVSEGCLTFTKFVQRTTNLLTFVPASAASLSSCSNRPGGNFPARAIGLTKLLFCVPRNPYTAQKKRGTIYDNTVVDGMYCCFFVLHFGILLELTLSARKSRKNCERGREYAPAPGPRSHHME